MSTTTAQTITITREQLFRALRARGLVVTGDGNAEAVFADLAAAARARAVVPVHRAVTPAPGWRCHECGTADLVDRRMRYETEPPGADQYHVELCDTCGGPLCDQCVLSASHRCVGA